MTYNITSCLPTSKNKFVDDFSKTELIKIERDFTQESIM